MSDPRRLLDEGADSFEARLLRAGQGDAPSARNRRRVMAGLGLSGVLSASVTASSAKASAQGWLSTSAAGGLRWVGGGALSAVAVWAGVHAVTPTAPAPVPAPQRAPMAATLPANPAASEQAREAPSVVAEADAVAPMNEVVRPGAARAVAPQRAATAEGAQDSLSAELGALDGARRALLNHDASGALRLLDAYERRFPKRRLNTEASVLRIEALAARGDRDSAARMGKAFLARHPNGPYARRVSSLIAEPSSAAKAEP